MENEMLTITKSINNVGVVEYHFWADQTWDGFDSIVKYLQKYWSGKVITSNDEVYSRRWTVLCQDLLITIMHDGNIGNVFCGEEAKGEHPLLVQIEADLVRRLSAP